MIRNVRIEIQLEGGGAWMGQGRNLAEALNYFGQYLPDDLSALERKEIADAIGAPAFTAEIRSIARWWNPLSWGCVELKVRAEGTWGKPEVTVE